jgi:hypothetical protein
MPTANTSRRHPQAPGGDSPSDLVIAADGRLSGGLLQAGECVLQPLRLVAGAAQDRRSHLGLSGDAARPCCTPAALSGWVSAPTTTTLAFLKAGYNVTFVRSRSAAGRPARASQAMGGWKPLVMLILRMTMLYDPLRIFFRWGWG